MSAPRALLPEASALWAAPEAGAPWMPPEERPLSIRDMAMMLWRLRELSEWERRAKAWWNTCGWTWT